MSQDSKYSNDPNAVPLSDKAHPQHWAWAEGHAAGLNEALEALPEKWLLDPVAETYRGSTAYFKARGHDEAIDQAKANLNALKE